jgi:hypothetical protein
VGTQLSGNRAIGHTIFAVGYCFQFSGGPLTRLALRWKLTSTGYFRISRDLEKTAGPVRTNFPLS